ncbi:glutamate racemase [Fulvivirga kasyanovii]|uniref:Glutamate racemase n=1 Tax=Fulvivirga kasyanovii TaxID=396812 RepID=A0ABW9RMV4_9BACT|nr:glutamate racemase [Fulvivirga kasyanovii]MTI25427.1 glutamate racemase [Fulvivirga kasyanovii]
MNFSTGSPIGIFDSGIGGLTVAHAIRNVLPHESMIYFGDTAHLPYGDKSEAAVQAYSVKIADVLLKKGCKVIVIACNSASSAAYELLKEYTGKRAKVINVIDPMVSYIKEHFIGQKIGLIGTKRTVQSNVYAKKVKQLKQNIQLVSVATPLLVPMIEEGFFNNKISYEIIEKYLDISQFKDIEALILGCTHYPLIKKQINDFFNGKVRILDSSEITAKYLKNYLTESNLLAPEGQEVKDEFLVSDFTQSFEASTKIFFRELVHLEKYPLWD